VIQPSRTILLCNKCCYFEIETFPQSSQLDIRGNMLGKQKTEQEHFKKGVSNVESQEKHQSTDFSRSETTNFEVTERRDPGNKLSFTLSLNENLDENEISKAIARLTRVDTLILTGKEQKLNLSAVASLKNQIQTCILHNLQLKPNLNEKSNAIYTLTNLRRLELIKCDVRQLHDAISKLASLQTLLIWDTPAFSALPFSMSKLTSLRCLSLAATDIHIDSLVSIATKLSSLQMLKLSAAQIETSEAAVAQTNSVERIDVIGSSITALPTQIGHLTALQEFDLGTNQISLLPSEICRLHHLTRLLLCFNQLSSFPSQLPCNLIYLNLEGNQITSIPPDIGCLTALQQLLLSYNQITSLPSDIGCLTALQVLMLADNRITSLPSDIGCLNALQVLMLADNQITSLPTDIGRLNALQELDINFNQITSLPTQINHLTALQKLSLCLNQITSLPTQIDRLTAIQELDLGANHLSLVPAEICQLHRLTRLLIGSNQLSSFPPQLPCNLIYLNLNGSQITSLPTQISVLTAIQKLSLNENQVAFLPTQIGLLARLQILELVKNQITSLPTQVGLLTALKRLYLHNNSKLSFIPSDLGMLSNLRDLVIFNTDLTFVPPLKLCSFDEFQPFKFPPNQVVNDYAEFVEVYDDLYSANRNE
jgi:Leucine-rich repeat (LRR) protein